MQYDHLILYDWFSVTAKHQSPLGMVQLLGMDIGSFQEIKGARGYRKRLYFGGVSVHYDSGRGDTWLEMSGQGCRSFESFGHGAWDTLFEEVLSDDDYHITRLDVAFDDHVGLFDLEYMAAEARAKNYVSRLKDWDIHESSKGMTLYHGSSKSNILFRIYDKARERSREDEGHWIRFEMQLRDKHAKNFLNFMILQPIGEVFAKIVNNYLRYVQLPAGNDTNKWRWPMADFWYNFISVSEKLTLYESPGTEYNLERLERFAVHQAGAAVATYIELVGLDTYLAQSGERLERTVNPKYNDLLRKHSVTEHA